MPPELSRNAESADERAGARPASPVHRVVDRLRRQIQQGTYKAGQKLPPVRQLGGELGVSNNTITAALGILESQRMVIRDPRRGVFAHRPGEAIRKLPVGLVTPLAHEALRASDNWAGHVTLGCFSELVRRELTPELIYVPSSGNAGWAGIEKLLLERRDELGGVIVTWSICDEDTLQAFVKTTGLPVIKIGRSSHRCQHNYVSIDHFGAGRLAADKALAHLDAPGPFLVLSGPSPHDFPRRQLANGFLDRIQEARLGHFQLDVIRVEQDTLASGGEAIQRYLAHHPAPRCVFSVGDNAAIGAMDHCLSAGLRVPDDIAFIGSAGLDACRVCKPTLAHTQQPMEQLGAATVDLLTTMYAREQAWQIGCELPVEWVEGNSL